MKRRAILYATDCEEKRFDNYLFRKQLPFDPAPLPEHIDLNSDRGKRRAEYSVANAFELRLMLDLTDQGGIDVESAQYAAGNAVRKLRWVSGEPTGDDLYIALVTEVPLPGEDFTRKQLFACRLADLHLVLADNTEPDQVRRVTLVNASAASRFVLARAGEFGVFQEHDARPAWDMVEVY